MFSYCLAPTGSSLKENGYVLVPIHAFYIADILTKSFGFVKSSAFLPRS